MLDRLYRGNFVPQEKKALVADLNKSKGAFLASVDDNPLVLFDAASQIATSVQAFWLILFKMPTNAVILTKVCLIIMT